jgi:hypothetical protein
MKIIKNYTDFLKKENTNVSGGPLQWESTSTDKIKNESIEDECIRFHNEIRSLIDAKDFVGLREYLEPFAHSLVDPNFLKTILVITKSFAENEEIKDVRQRIKERLENQLGSTLEKLEGSTSDTPIEQPFSLTGGEPDASKDPGEVERAFHSVEEYNSMYYYSIPLIVKIASSADGVYQKLDNYIYNGLGYAIGEAENEYSIDLSWLEYEIKNYQPSAEELTDKGYVELDEDDEDSEEKYQSPEDFYWDLDDQEKFEIYFTKQSNWKQFESEIENIELNFKDLGYSKRKEISEVIVDDFNDAQLEQYCDELPEGVLQSLTAIDENDGRLIIEAKTKGSLTEDQIYILRDYISGQCSDGWGEGREQEEIEGYYISTWSHDDETRYDGQEI